MDWWSIIFNYLFYFTEVHCLPVYFEPDAERVEGQETSMAIIRKNNNSHLMSQQTSNKIIEKYLVTMP